MQTKSVCHIEHIEMNVTHVSTRFQDVASLHLSHLSGMEWPGAKFGQSCLL